MATGIQISTQKLHDTAKTIRDKNREMTDKLADIKKKMNDLEANWNSDAARDIRANMNALQPKFDQYRDVVESYAQFLVETAQNYENTEDTIQKNAGAFKQ